MKSSIVAGVDIGGSHITAALISLTNRRILPGSQRRDIVNANGTSEEIISGWASVIRDCFASHQLQPGRTGIAMPGPFDYSEGISLMKDQGKYRSLYKLKVKELLAEALDTDKADITFTNDAACFLQGELFSGVAKGYNTVFGITLGTGFGSAFAKEGLAADADLWCMPFKNGIAEDYFSHGALIAKYAGISGRDVSNVKELADLTETDEMAKVIFTELGINLGDLFVAVLTNRPVELIVIGGNISKAFNKFYPALKAVFQYHGLDIPVKVTQLGEHASLVGAASEWHNRMGTMIGR
ncbi:MAG TPA: ROK family protein [Chitinophagaceae bacterium]|nr:ROK family protein [Chitinophagaceae bacterium]